MIEKALDQGISLPDTISTDLDDDDGDEGPVWDLPDDDVEAAPFRHVAASDIVGRATAAPAKIMGYEGSVGTLKPGANADVTLLELRDGNFDLTDSGWHDDHRQAPPGIAQMTRIKDGRVTYQRVESRPRLRFRAHPVTPVLELARRL